MGTSRGQRAWPILRTDALPMMKQRSISCENPHLWRWAVTSAMTSREVRCYQTSMSYQYRHRVSTQGFGQTLLAHSAYWVVISANMTSYASPKVSKRYPFLPNAYSPDCLTTWTNVVKTTRGTYWKCISFADRSEMKQRIFLSRKRRHIQKEGLYGSRHGRRSVSEADARLYYGRADAT